MVMARAGFRWTGSLLLLLVLSLGLAQNENAKVPPRAGCVFEEGRTVCVEVDRGTTTQQDVGSPFRTHQTCGWRWSGYLYYWRVRTQYVTPITTTTTTFRGNSHVVENEDVVHSVEIVAGPTRIFGCL